MATENDLVLIYFENKPLIFARIEDILPDAKPDWYHVKLLLLQVPLQLVTWILRDVYINGAEFSMNGKKMRLEKVVSPEAADADDLRRNQQNKKKTPQTSNGAKVISLSDLKGK